MAEATGTLKRKPIPVSRTGSTPRKSPLPASATRNRRCGAGADNGAGLVGPAG